MALGNLKITLDLVADQFVSGIRKAEAELKGLGQTIMSPSFQNAAATIGVGFIAMGTAVSTALAKSAKSAADYGDEMLELSQKTGISTQALGGYKLAAEQSGTSLAGLSTGVKALSTNMLAAATGSASQARLFGALGISVKDASGSLRNASDILPELADRFAGIEDVTLRNALATKLFGRSGTELIPLLMGGSEALRTAQEAAEKYGLAMTEAEAATGDKFNDSVAETKLAIEGLQNSIGIVLLPTLTDLINKANEWIATASQWAKANPQVTEGLAALSVVLIGSGGLLLGLTGIVALLPSLKAGLAIVGVTSIAATAPIIAYTAAVLGAVASLWAAYDIGQELRRGHAEVLSGSPGAVAKNVLGGSTNVGLAYMTYQALRAPSVPMPDFGGVKGGSSTMTPGGSNDELRKILKLLGEKGEADEAKKKAEEARKELERFNKTVADMTASLTGTVQPSEELVAVIYRLHNTGKLTSDVMLALAKDIDTLKNSNDPLIQSIVRGIPFLQISAKSYQMMAENIRLVDEATKAYRPDVLTLPVDMSMDGIGGPLGRGDIEGNQRLEELIERRKELSDQWGESLGRVSDKLVDMIVDFDFSFRRLGDIAKSTVKEMATSFLDGFFKPFKDQLTGMGKDAGDWLGELAFGKTGGGGGGGGDKGLFGGLLSTFGGLFGGKGDKNSPFGDPTAGVWNPHGGGGGGLLGKLGLGNAFGGVGGAATGLMGSLNPISAGLGIANGAFDLASKITGKLGSGRDSANEIVKSQNSFVNQTLAGILSDPDLSPTNKLKMVNNAWDAYQTNLGNYGASGGENAVTSNQAFATVAPLVSQIKSDLIKGGATDTTGAEGGTYNITVNITTTDEIRSVEDLIHIIKFNKGGATTEMTKAVINMEGAITAR